MKLPKFLRKYGGTDSTTTNVNETPYVPNITKKILEKLPIIIEKGEKGAIAKGIFPCKPNEIKKGYGDLLKEHQEEIIYAMENGFLELYAFKPTSDVDPASLYEFILVDRKHLLLLKHPNLKPGEVISLNSKRMGKKYAEYYNKLIEEDSKKLSVNDLFSSV